MSLYLSEKSGIFLLLDQDIFITHPSKEYPRVFEQKFYKIELIARRR